MPTGDNFNPSRPSPDSTSQNDRDACSPSATKGRAILFGENEADTEKALLMARSVSSTAARRRSKVLAD
jgi:hypothetical protein